MDAARGALHHWRFTKMYSGDAVPFQGPGIVLKCREFQPVTSSEHRYQIAEIMGAKNDAGAARRAFAIRPRAPGSQPRYALRMVRVIADVMRRGTTRTLGRALPRLQRDFDPRGEG